MTRDAMIARIRKYQHLIAGSECYITFDGTEYSAVENGLTVTKMVSEDNKPGVVAPELSAWNNLGTVDSVNYPNGEKTTLPYKKCTVGGQVKLKFELVVEETNNLTIRLLSVPKEICSIIFGTPINGIGTFKPFQNSTWTGWLKCQSVDESKTLRFGMDLYCNFTVDGQIEVKGNDFAAVTLQCRVNDADLNAVYNGTPNAE